MRRRRRAGTAPSATLGHGPTAPRATIEADPPHRKVAATTAAGTNRAALGGTIKAGRRPRPGSATIEAPPQRLADRATIGAEPHRLADIATIGAVLHRRARIVTIATARRASFATIVAIPHRPAPIVTTGPSGAMTAVPQRRLPNGAEGDASRHRRRRIATIGTSACRRRHATSARGPVRWPVRATSAQPLAIAPRLATIGFRSRAPARGSRHRPERPTRRCGCRSG